MADIRIAAILREGIFSPNHIANDAAILHDTASELRKKGFPVKIYSESQFIESDIDEDIIMAMCRRRESVEKLQILEETGRIVVNSGYGIENCIRMFMLGIFQKAGVPVPDSIVVKTNIDARKKLNNLGFGAAWVKIADDHLHHLEDVCRCRHTDEVQEILHEFFLRKIGRAVVSKSVEGVRIRFYGVASIGWFHYFAPFSTGTLTDSETIEEMSGQIETVCMKAAESLNVDIFGGDLTITQSGECFIENFDDWPSFAPIRKEAAKAIAKSVLNRARKLISIRKRS